MDMSFKELVVKNRSYRGYDHSRWLTREELSGLNWTAGDRQLLDLL